MPEQYWHINNCRLFSRLDESTLRRIESRSKIRSFKRGEPVYLPADAADGIMLLVAGRVRICHITPEGKQSIMVFVDPGEIFGELAVLDGGSRNEYAEAAENCQVVLIPRAEMQWLMQQYADISFGITKLIGFRRQRIEKRLRNLLFRSNRERLILLLLELVEQYGETDNGVTHLNLKLSHQELANIIGSTRETVTVVLGKLQSEGYLEIARRKIRITNLPGLAKQVQERVPESKMVRQSIPTGQTPNDMFRKRISVL